MRAAFSDPEGPKAWRFAPYALPIAVLLFAMFGPIEGMPAAMTGLAGFAGFHALGLFDRRQRKPRPVDLVLDPGAVVVTNAGSRNQRVHAKDITGATTARTKAGLLLTLQHRRRQAPITLLVANEAEADKIRQALGIGHGGFGTVVWRTQSDPSHRAAFVGRLLAVAYAVITMALTLGASEGAGIVAGILLGIFGFIGAVMGLVGLSSRAAPPTIVMTADGLQLLTPRGWFAVPYGGVNGVADYGRAFHFAVPEPYTAAFVAKASPTFGGPSAHDAEVLVAQISAAALRARGLGPHKNDVTARVDVLRRNGESARDWLVRLDVAGQMLSAGPGYRGSTVDTEDLWAILEDPEADADLRAAAARVLRHSNEQDSRVRIDAAVAAVRDDATHRRLRIGLQDDLESASQELALLEESESAPRQTREAGWPPGHGR